MMTKDIKQIKEEMDAAMKCALPSATVHRAIQKTMIALNAEIDAVDAIQAAFPSGLVHSELQRVFPYATSFLTSTLKKASRAFDTEKEATSALHESFSLDNVDGVLSAFEDGTEILFRIKETLSPGAVNQALFGFILQNKATKAAAKEAINKYVRALELKGRG